MFCAVISSDHAGSVSVRFGTKPSSMGFNVIFFVSILLSLEHLHVSLPKKFKCSSYQFSVFFFFCCD
jgi:hypothetical protein